MIAKDKYGMAVDTGDTVLYDNIKWKVQSVNRSKLSLTSLGQLLKVEAIKVEKL
jgi:hypothetical protein